MAKKNDTAYDSFLADLKAINPAVEELLKDDKVSAKLRESVLARADYSANMDELRTQRETFATEVEQARERIKGWQTWYGDVTQQVATINDKVKQYEDAYGPIETAGDKRRAAQAIGVSKEDMESLVESRMNQRDIAALKFADDLTDIKIDFKDRFKDRLDTEQVFKLAGERGVDLKTAYSVFINDRVEEQRTKDVDERIKQARVEAVTEYASKHNLPVAPSNSDMVHTLDARDVPATSRDRIAAAVANVNLMRSGR